MGSIRQYNLVDLVKLLLSILVVGLHTFVFLSVNRWLHLINTQIITRIAVPVFFAYSGYFLAYKSDKEIIRHIFKLLRLYMIWSVVYYPWIFMGILEKYSDVSTVQIIKKSIVLFLEGNSYQHLWFLPAACIGAFSLLMLRRIDNKGGVVAIVLLLFLIALFSDTYYGLGNLILPEYRNIHIVFDNFELHRLVTLSVPYMMIGGWIASEKYRYNQKLESITCKCVLTGIICFMIYVFEIVGLYILNFPKDYIISIGQMFFVIWLVWVTTEVRFQYNTDFKKIRFLSAWIYLVHLWLRNVIRVICGPDINTMVQFCFVIVMSVISGLLFYRKYQRN